MLVVLILPFKQQHYFVFKIYIVIQELFIFKTSIQNLHIALKMGQQ